MSFKGMYVSRRKLKREFLIQITPIKTNQKITKVADDFKPVLIDELIISGAQKNSKQTAAVQQIITKKQNYAYKYSWVQ